MNKLVGVTSRQNNESYALPDQAFTAEGIEFDPSADYWKLRTRMTADFSHLLMASERFQIAVKRVLMVLLGKGNPHSSLIGYRQFSNLFRSIPDEEASGLDSLDARHISNWISLENNARYVPLLRIFLNAANELNAQIVTKEGQDFFDSLKITANKSAYENIKTWNPIAGPYRPAEDQELKKALNDGFNDGRIGLREYFICRIFRGFGIRPEQLAQMKVCDMRFVNTGSEIRLPLVKQRSAQRREVFSSWRPVSQGFANIAALYIRDVVEPLVLDSSKLKHAPLVLKAHQQAFVPSDCMKHHVSRDICQKTFQGVWEKLAVISPISGELIRINPRRERHTYGTQLAMEGASAEEIAINMGHASVQACEAYVDASIEHYQRMEAIVGESFVPIADRFLGKLTSQVDQLADKGYALFDRNTEQVGSCNSGGCLAVDAGVAPIACYTCRKFNAWEDGPHLSILEVLLDEQKRLNEMGHSKVAETKTETIVAIYDLMAAIRLMNEK